jgi:hypothetical protein
MLSRLADIGGEERVYELVADGVSLSKVAEMIGAERARLSDWMHGDEARKARLARAREVAAGALIEQGLAIVDEATEPSEVPSAKLRSEYRRWMASRMAPEAWGEQKGPQVAIQINGLHLDALRTLGKVGKAE